MVKTKTKKAVVPRCGAVYPCCGMSGTRSAGELNIIFSPSNKGPRKTGVEKSGVTALPHDKALPV